MIWSPQPRQAVFMSRPEYECLYGGAAGGGKSDALINEALRQVHIPNYRGLILRRTFPQLEALISRSRQLYQRAFPAARYVGSDHRWEFPSGATIFFGSMQLEDDKYKYQGKPYDFIAFDELTHFTLTQYMYLMSRNRPVGPGTRVYIRATANPGGVGHGWVKARFIDAAPPMVPVEDTYEVADPGGKIIRLKKKRVFVNSSVFDNQKLLENDPNYLATLAMLPEAERDALLYGDWTSFEGQFFREFRDDPAHYEDRQGTHVIEPFEVPDSWQIYRSFDFGYSRPFSVGWWAVDYEGRLYRILELYGCKDKNPNTGLRWQPDKIFGEIARIEREHRWLKGKNILGVADPSIWDGSRGVSVAEMAARQGVYFEKGVNERLPGWMQVHYRMTFDEGGIPMMYVFRTCRAFIRTMPALTYSETHVEDLDTDGEDHVADEVRYMCMARPIKPVAVQERKAKPYNPLDDNETYGRYDWMRM